MKNLPSKKLLISLAGILLPLAAIFWVAYGRLQAETETPTVALAIGTAQTSASAPDKDSDGLKDWEEELWKTDPFNPDTDGDGTPDGEEVRLSRNPTKAGPDDAYSPTQGGVNTDQNPQALALQGGVTATDIFARELLLQYKNPRDSGTLTEEEQARILESSLAYAQGTEPKLSTRADLTIGTDDSPEAVRAFGNALASIYNRYADLAQYKELDILFKALETESAVKLNDLEPIIARSEALLRDYRALEIPPSAVSVYLEALHIDERAYHAVQGFKNFFYDPIGGAVSVQQYTDLFDRASAVHLNLQKYFFDHGVTFAASEPGYVFNL